jgi:hypothetical protein
VLFKFTYQGDFTLDGQVNQTDFAIVASNFNTAQVWTGGDSNYDGLATIGDYSQLAKNWMAGTGGNNLRPGPDRLPPLAELYLLMLDHPAIYWESRLWPEFWNRYFAQFENMNLGPVPAVPAYLTARGIPEAGAGAVLILATVAAAARRRRA